MTLADYDNEPVAVWPDNWSAVQLFARMRTQWRVGAGGAVGLDYNVLYRMMDRMSLAAEAYDGLEHDIQLMEDEVLALLASQQDQG